MKKMIYISIIIILLLENANDAGKMKHFWVKFILKISKQL